jgi:hypothetical protein
VYARTLLCISEKLRAVSLRNDDDDDDDDDDTRNRDARG